jgi:hypothetical protein
MSQRMAIAPQCLNINYWITGPHQNLFVTLQASLVVQFYSTFITYFKLTVNPLQDIMQCEYTSCVEDLWTPAAVAAFDELCLLHSLQSLPLSFQSQKS